MFLCKYLLHYYSVEHLFGAWLAEDDTGDAFKFLIIHNQGWVHRVQRPRSLEVLHRVLVQLNKINKVCQIQIHESSLSNLIDDCAYLESFLTKCHPKTCMCILWVLLHALDGLDEFVVHLHGMLIRGQFR